MHEKEDCVCPTLRDNLFTTGDIDNHNPPSTLSCDSFHGTALFIIQHTTYENADVVRMHMETAHNRYKPKGESLKSLPKSYTSLNNTIQQ